MEFKNQVGHGECLSRLSPARSGMRNQGTKNPRNPARRRGAADFAELRESDQEDACRRWTFPSTEIRDRGPVLCPDRGIDDTQLDVGKHHRPIGEVHHGNGGKGNSTGSIHPKIRMRMLVIRRVMRLLLAVLRMVVIRVALRCFRRSRMTLGRHRAAEADR